MNNLRHPSELNAYQIYQQASAIAKGTSRAKNPDWYVDAYSIQRQWHLWIDGKQVISTLFDAGANRWVDGPEISCLDELMGKGGEEVEGTLVRSRTISAENIEELNNCLAEILRSRELGGKVSSLGVVIHVASEFAALDPAREHSSNGDFEEVQAALLLNPQEVLGDSTADPLLNTWCIVPCWGVKEGKMCVALQLGRGVESFFSAVRDYGEANNIAIVAAGVSAPLEALSLAPVYLEWGEERGRGDIIVLLYRNFSALAVLDGEGELIVLRSLAHRAGAEYPSGLGEVLLNTQTSLGLEHPVVTIVPMNAGSAQELLSQDLTSFFLRKTPMDIGFSELDQIEALQAIPGNRLEMFLGDKVSVQALLEGDGLYENSTFTALAAGWATQDFFPVAYEEDEKYPHWQDLQLRKWFGLVKGVLLAAVVGLAVFFGIKYVEVASTDSWKASESDLVAAKLKMTKLTTDQKQIDFWKAIMAKRSEGWLVMELLLKLFPENSGTVITSSKYAVRADRAAAKRGEVETKTGFYREWVIQGFVAPKALPYLTQLGSTGAMKKSFEEIAGKYGADQYSMLVPGRTMNVSLQRKQGSYNAGGGMSAEEAATYKTSFTLVITQRYSADDPLAIPVKAEAKPK